MKRKKLDKFLVDYDLKQNEVAEYLKVSENHFSLLVNGKSNPSYNLMGRFRTFCIERNFIPDDFYGIWDIE